jgi:hypothetical protein
MVGAPEIEGAGVTSCFVEVLTGTTVGDVTTVAGIAGVRMERVQVPNNRIIQNSPTDLPTVFTFPLPSPFNAQPLLIQYSAIQQTLYK